MERNEAIDKLQPLIGRDLRQLADRLSVTVWKGEKINKGWVGHTIERFLGLPINSSRAPNFGSWELKVVSVKYLRNGALVPKETMAITMIDPREVSIKSFEDSHVYAKMRKILIVARIYENESETRSRLHGIAEFDLDNHDIYDCIKADYDRIRCVINTSGFESLNGRMGTYIQPRTKGTGHGSTTRAFYARKNLISIMIGLGN